MKFIRRTLLAVAMTSLFSVAFGQYEAAIFDYQNAYFNNGQPLKPASDLLISGNVNRDIERVELSIYNDRKKDKHPLFHNVWKRSYGNTQENFQLPVTYNLRGNTDYDITIDYYRVVTAAEKETLKTVILQMLDKYIEESYFVQKWRLRPTRSHKAMVKDMNTIVAEMLHYYRNDTEITFPGFSDMVAESLKPLREPHLHHEESLEFVSLASQSLNKEMVMAAAYKRRLEGLKEVIRLEIEQIVNTHLMICADSRQVIDYPTERERGEIAINGGYAGIYTGDYKTQMSFVGAPFVGLSIPFGKSSFSNPFFSNSSISVGGFVGNIKNSSGESIKGPLFGNPLYAGLGYKILGFARINVGASAINNNNNRGTNLASKFEVRPFVGVSAEINLSMRIGNKKKK